MLKWLRFAHHVTPLSSGHKGVHLHMHISPLLLDHFLDEASEKLSRQRLSIPPELLPLLDAYDFPGNIRELRSMVFDAVARQSEKILSLKPFKETIGRNGQILTREQRNRLFTDRDRLPTLAQTNAILIEEAMRRANGVKATAAILRGITPQALGKRLDRRKQVWSRER